jgi:hypothetical protein
VLAASIITAASTSETSVNFYHTTRRNNREERHIYVVSGAEANFRKSRSFIRKKKDIIMMFKYIPPVDS